MSLYNQHTIPKDGMAGLKENFKNDLLSGFMVSLLALPLSLGIARASDFPNPMYGVLTAIIGGMLVSLVAGSRLTIKGPAAGLIVIVAGAVSEFGGGDTGWKMALGTIVVAGILQIIFGILKLGRLSDFFPLPAVHGMLAAIGLIILSKQLHVLIGMNPVGENGKPLVEPFELIKAIPQSFSTIQERIPIVITGLVCISLVFLIPMSSVRILKKTPMPLIILLASIPLGFVFGLKNVEGGLIRFNSSFTSLLGYNVDFSGWSNMMLFIKYVILFAVIGSLESLLTVKAVDMLDPYRRKSDTNKELMAVGGGNILSGILGGLPMISEVARSSANISNGAKTRWGNFFHGFFLLIFMLALTPLIEMIPNAALAAMLIGVGYRLTHPKEFIHTYRLGKDQFFIFLTTIIVTLSVDLLAGVFAGILVNMIIHVFNGTPINKLFTSDVEVLDQHGNFYVTIRNAATFSNWSGIKKELYAIPHHSLICINLSECVIVDRSVMENIQHFKRDVESSGGTVEITGLDDHKSFGDHPLSARKKEK